MMTPQAANSKVEDLERRAGEVSRHLKALANPNRLRILCELMRGEAAVGEIEKKLDFKQPNLSRELAKLRAGGYVATRREAKVIFYSVVEGPITMIISSLCGASGKDARKNSR